MLIIKNKSRLIISIALVVAMAFFIHQTGKFSPSEAYTDLAISYDENQGFDLEQYIVQDLEGLEKFLVAPTTPSALQLKLIPDSNAAINLKIEPQYLPQDCTLGQTGLSTLQLDNGSKNDDRQTITLNRVYDIDLKLVKGQGLGIHLDDGKDGRCGKARFTFLKENSSLQYLSIFIATWSILALILTIVKSNPLIAVLGAILNLLLILANLTVYTPSLPSFSFTVLFSAGVTGLALLFLSLPVWGWLRVTLIAALIGTVAYLPIVFICYPLIFNAPISEDTIHAILQSNVRQAFEFWQAFISIKYNVALILGALILFLVVYWIIKPVINRVATFAVALLLILASVIANQGIISNTPIIALTINSVNGYFKELETFKELREERISKLQEMGAITDQDNQTLVVVLGESASKHHISSYGYGRDTTPNADRLINAQKMIRFDAVYSNHVLSNPTISKALTSSSNYTDTTWINSPSILNLANAAGIKTSWVSNKPMYGVWDNHMNVIGNEASDVSFINKRVGTRKYSSEDDAAMLPLVHQAITADNNNELIFMHLQGSHVHYCERVPDGFDYFKNTPEKHVYGSFLSTDQNSAFITRFINCYDNSIRYSDYVLNDLIEHLDTLNKPSAVLYVPDHGENVMDNKAHNVSVFDYYMTEIPAYFWANNQWRQKNSNIWQNLNDNREKVFTNDHLFELVNGLMGITSQAVDTNNDLSSKDYVEPITPKTLHGEVKLNAADNWTFWQRQNIRTLKTDARLNKIVADRVNTTSKAGTMLKQGLGTLEIDINLLTSASETNFIVGHDALSTAEITLDNFINHMEWSEITRLWLDLRNLNSKNIELVLSRLNAINQKIPLKQKSVLIVNESNEEFRRLSESGYDVAYAPNESELKALLSSTIGSREREQATEEISAFANAIGASMISLPANIYLLIEPHLDTLAAKYPSLSLHLRSPSDIDLATPDLSEKLLNKNYFIDKRVSAISLKVRARRDL